MQTWGDAQMSPKPPAQRPTVAVPGAKDRTRRELDAFARRIVLEPLALRRFCATGEGAHWRMGLLLAFPPKQDSEYYRQLLALYDRVCPCVATEPPWVAQARALASQDAGRSAKPVFPNIYRYYGPEMYQEAVDTLIEYRRRHKSFHPVWAPLYTAVNESMVTLTEDGTAAIAIPTNRTGTDALARFLKHMKAPENWQKTPITGAEEAAVTLIGHLEGKLRDKVKGELEAFLRTPFTNLVGPLETLKLIKSGIDAKNIAKKAFDSEESRDYRLRFFLKLGVAGDKYIDYYKKYKAYDQIYWKLQTFRMREAEGNPKSRSGPTIGNPPARLLRVLPTADPDG